MSDLISREALIQHAYSAVVDGVEKDIIDLSDVDNAPTIIWCNQTSDGLPLFDLRERPKGEWKVIHNALEETKYQCNQCQHYIKSSDDKNFCPNCGSQMNMRGEKDGNNTL